MSDLISREAATEGFESVTWHDPRDADIAHEVIGELPSVHPTQNNTFNTLKALDCISRQAAMEAIKKVEYVIVYNVAMTQEEVIDAATDTLIAALTRDIEELPSAEPEPNFDEWCTDCKEYDQERHCCPRWNRVIRETLKDAEPERKTGKWIYGEHDVAMCDGYWCDKCGFFVPWDYEHKFIDFINDYHFCPSCGAKMEGNG